MYINFQYDFVNVKFKIMKLPLNLILKFILILKFNNSKSNKINIQFLENLFTTYNLYEVFIVIPDTIIIENLMDIFLKIPNIHFNIHSKDLNKSIHHHKQELLILQSLHFLNVRNKINARFILYILTDELNTLETDLLIFGYLNVLIFQNNTLLKYNEANKKFINLTSFETIKSTDYFEIPEFGWPVLSPAYIEGMDTWLYPMVIDQKTKYSGILGYLMYVFSDYINSRIKNKLNLTDLKNRKREYIMLGYNNFRKIDGFPLLSTKQCLMLPILDEILVHEYLRKAFSKWLWLFLLLFSLYISVILRFFIHRNLFDCVFESFTISCGSLYKGLSTQNLRDRIIYTLLFVYGFIIWNLYSAKTFSYLSSANKGRILKTIDDIIKEKVTLWTSIQMFEQEDLIKKEFPSIYSFKEKLTEGQFDLIVPRNTFTQNLYSLNNSFGYLIPDYTWSYISLTQSILNEKIFSISDFCFEFGYVYPINFYTNYVGMDEVKAFFYMRVLESGFDYIWRQFTYYDIKMKHFKTFKDTFLILNLTFF